MRGRTTQSGQIHTLEGFTAAFIILFAMLFAFQSVSVTPTSSSTASQQVETNNYVLADDVMATAAESGALKDAVLDWDDDDRSYNGTPLDRYQGRNPAGEFGDMLNELFFSQGLAYNIDIYCGGGRTKPFVERGEPSRHAITASQSIVLHDNDTLTHPDHDDTELWEADGFQSRICPQASEDSNLYNVMEVEITVWRM